MLNQCNDKVFYNEIDWNVASFIFKTISFCIKKTLNIKVILLSLFHFVVSREFKNKTKTKKWEIDFHIKSEKENITWKLETLKLNT